MLLSSSAFAEQARGTYTLDRSETSPVRDQHGRIVPSCGVDVATTFVVEYSEVTRVNKRD